MWDYFATIVTIISTLVSLYNIIKLIIEKYIITYIPIFGKCFSWRQINHMVQKICKEINGVPIKFGSIVGIGRGGSIFASLMSYQLGAIPIFSFDRRYEIDNGNKTVSSIVKNIELANNFRHLLDQPVLLVSQRSDPGITIQKYKSLLERIGFKNVRVCAVLVSEDSSFTNVDYYYQKYNSSKRIKTFPWIYKKPNIMNDKEYLTIKSV